LTIARCKEINMKINSIFDLVAILITIALFVLAVIASIDVATAQSSAAPQTRAAGGEHHGPPPEALAACNSAKLNQACSFAAPNGTVNGNCWQPDADHPLACRPDHGAHDATKTDGNGGANDASTQRRGPPPEALAACQSHKLNDKCIFSSPRGTENGTCFQPDASHPLACRPARG
jgi:hypothetical protein